LTIAPSDGRPSAQGGPAWQEVTGRRAHVGAHRRGVRRHRLRDQRRDGDSREVRRQPWSRPLASATLLASYKGN